MPSLLSSSFIRFLFQNRNILKTFRRRVRSQTSIVSRCQQRKARSSLITQSFEQPFVDKEVDVYKNKFADFKEESFQSYKVPVFSNINTDLQTNEFIYGKNFKKKDIKFHIATKTEDISKPLKDVTTENRFERLNEQVTPLWKLPYNVQLKVKFKKNKKMLVNFGSKLKSIKAKVLIDKIGLPCPLESVKPSPVIDAYRNKDEFSIRTGVDGNPKTVGFYLGSSAENPNVVCVEPDHLLNTRDSHKKIAKAFQTYIRQSPLPPCIHFSEGGYWRNIVVRSNMKGDVMTIIRMHPQKLTKEELDSEKEKLTIFFSKDGNFPYLKSLYFQPCPHSRCTHKQVPYELLMGDSYLLEEVNGVQFMISPETFFQVNTAAAKILYDTICKISGVASTTTVLDICCGVGAISLVLAPYVCKVIGIEANDKAVQDAKHSSEINNIKNATFFCGRAEQVLPNILDEIYTEDMVAILNPSRQGFYAPMMKMLRECRHLKRIVYISCKPEGQPLVNFVDLCKPAGKNAKLGQPFVPLMAIPVDMFPHTDHCELIIVFERLKDCF